MSLQVSLNSSEEVLSLLSQNARYSEGPASTLHKSAQHLSKVGLHINYSQVSLRTVLSERSKLKLTIREDIRSR